MTVSDSTYARDSEIRSRAMKTDMLSREEEGELTRRWAEHRDFEARDRLIDAHQRLVIGQARRFKRTGVGFQDLVNEGNLGLITAVERFDPESGNRFATYAAWWVHSMMQDYMLKNLSPVRIGRSRTERNALRKLSGRTGLSDEEASEGIEGLSELEVSRLRGALQPVSFDLAGEVGDGEVDYGAILPDESVGAVQIMEDAGAADRADLIRELLADLEPREREVLSKRHLCDVKTTLREIAEGMAVSAERVRQIEQSGLRKLRRAMDRRGLRSRDLLSERV